MTKRHKTNKITSVAFTQEQWDWLESQVQAGDTKCAFLRRLVQTAMMEGDDLLARLRRKRQIAAEEARNDVSMAQGCSGMVEAGGGDIVDCEGHSDDVEGICD